MRFKHGKHKKFGYAYSDYYEQFDNESRTTRRRRKILLNRIKRRIDNEVINEELNLGP